jgi:hypothetical protein
MSVTKEKVKVVLLKPHRHEGRDYPVGGTPLVSKRQADWLVGIKAARLPDAEAPSEPATAPAKNATPKADKE